MKEPFGTLLEKAWIDLHDPQVAWQIAILLAYARSDLNLAIWRAFREAGIEIPYPQREIRILPGAGGVRA